MLCSGLPNKMGSLLTAQRRQPQETGEKKNGSGDSWHHMDLLISLVHSLILTLYSQYMYDYYYYYCVTHSLLLGMSNAGPAGTVLYRFYVLWLSLTHCQALWSSWVEWRVCALCSTDHRHPHTTPVVIATKVPQFKTDSHPVQLKLHNPPNEKLEKF